MQFHFVEAHSLQKVAPSGRIASAFGAPVQLHDTIDAFFRSVSNRHRGVVLVSVDPPTGHLTMVLKRILRSYPRMAVIVLSSNGEVAEAVAAMKLGAVDFLEKPLNAERLMEAVAAGIKRVEEASEADAARTAIATLSSREREVFAGLIAGWSNKTIAQKLSISPRTIEVHRANIMTKLAVDSLPTALHIAFRAGFGGDRTDALIRG